MDRNHIPFGQQDGSDLSEKVITGSSGNGRDEIKDIGVPLYGQSKADVLAPTLSSPLRETNDQGRNNYENALLFERRTDKLDKATDALDAFTLSGNSNNAYNLGEGETQNSISGKRGTAVQIDAPRSDSITLGDESYKKNLEPDTPYVSVGKTYKNLIPFGRDDTDRTETKNRDPALVESASIRYGK